MLDLARAPLDALVDRQVRRFDGDGFVVSQPFQSRRANQGWKDSGDSIIYPDGSLVEPPIALCEVQGYVYNAWQRAADIYLG